MDNNNTQAPQAPMSLKDRVAQKMQPTSQPNPSQPNSNQPVSFVDRISQKLGLSPSSVQDTPQYSSTSTSGIFNNSVTYQAKDNQQPFVPQIKTFTDKVANGIMQTESGGVPRTGASGENGIFQFLPSTWQALSKKIAGQILPQTPENEWKVASQKVAQLYNKFKSQGLSNIAAARNTALVWNTSLGGSEKPLVKKGVNSKGVSYDSGKYAQTVLSHIK